MKKAEFSGKLSLKKRTISSLTSNSITGGTGTTNYCPTASLGCETDTTNANCTSGTSIVISCC
ncbi:class I lanthipeptide [Spongiimicrobium sp. 3-5]|uniref:class I lanthipeptide n=1 Tax=Spongiimicrobium sp. 3-5 TaxID=3332596 RepID=UPI00397EAD50